MRIPGIPYVQGRNSYPDADGKKYAIAVHSTGNTATAEQEASYATRRTDGVSSHFYVDSDSVVQSLDTDARAGHSGTTNGNENAIAFEITGTPGWTRQQWLDRVAWDRMAGVMAILCRTYGIAVRRATVAEMKANPKVRAFYGHNDMRLAWGGTTHTDPWPNFPWDRLFAAVDAALEDDMATAQEVWQTDGLVRAPDTRTDQTNLYWTAANVLTDADNAARAAAAQTAAMRQDLAEAKLRDEAILAATLGASGRDAVLSRVDQLAAELRAQRVAEVLAALPAGDAPVSRADVAAALGAVFGATVPAPRSAPGEDDHAERPTG